MNRPFACAFILLVAVSGGSPAGAQPVMPGEEGELVNFLPPEVGRRVCYARVYSQQHLAKHPKQKVAEIQFRLTYYRHEPDDYTPQGQRNYYFEVLARLRGQNDLMTSMGECTPAGSSIFCGVDCDGGGVNVTRRPPDKILVSLAEMGRLRMTNGCDESDSVDLEAGEDDKEFLLTKTEDASCPPYDDW